MSDLVIDKINEYAETLLPSMGLELFDVQFRQDDRGWVLRIYIDSEEGVTLEHCTKVSREFSSFLEVEDIIKHAYNLEVSSPGLERPIRNVQEFSKYSGKQAKIKLHLPVDGQKVFVGTIKEIIGDREIILQTESDKEIRFSMDDLNQARLYLA